MTTVTTPSVSSRGRLAHTRTRRRQIPVFVVSSALLIAAAVWSANSPQWRGNPLDVPSFVGWTLQSLAEPQFSVVAYAGVGLIVGGWFGHIAHTRHWRMQGFTQACGTGLWPAVAVAAVTSLVLSTLIWGWTLAEGLWQPLFVPIASIAPAIVVTYGPATKVVATAAGLGALIAPPCALVLVDLVCEPLALPPVIGVTGAMAPSRHSFCAGVCRGCRRRGRGASWSRPLLPTAQPRMALCGFFAEPWRISPRRSSSGTSGRASG